MKDTGATEWLQAVIDAGLALDPEIHRKLATMTGSVIRIRLKLVERELYFLPHEQGMHIRTNYTGNVDTTITGTPMALLKMGMSSQIAPALLKGEISIEGNTQTGREFKKILASLNIDWEELAAKIIGDTPAHQLFKMLRAMHHWGKKSAHSVTEDVSEYLQEESREIVSGAELNHFYQQIDELRDAVARIEHNIKQSSGSASSDNPTKK